MKNPYRPLERALGYRFRRKTWLEEALTHPSFRHEHNGLESDLQRLEFLGDAVLGAIAAAFLFRTYPAFQEGRLTRLRSDVTNTACLARLAAALELGPWLRLGRGEQLSGGQHRVSLLSDAFESVLGAVFMDGGWRAVERIFQKWFVPEIQAAILQNGTTNPKGELQELCQERWKQTPQYRVIEMQGPSHARCFMVEVLAGSRTLGRGKGKTRREAEAEAARQALEQIKTDSA